MSQTETVERLRLYFASLPLETRGELLAELDLAVLRDEAPPNADLIIQELTRGLRGSGVVVNRVPNPSRVFFNPLEPFLVDGAPEALRRGEIARATLSPVWAWICRDLMPEKAKIYTERTRNALLADDRQAANRLAYVFQDQVTNGLERAIATWGRQAMRHRLATYMAPPRAIDDIREMLQVFKGRDALAALAGSLPPRIEDLGAAELDRVRKALDVLAQADHDLMLHGLILVMRRLAAPWQLLRLAAPMTRADNFEPDSKTTHGIAVGLVLRHSEGLAASMEGQLASGEVIEAAEELTQLDAAVDALEAFDLPAGCVWAKRRAALRTSLEGLHQTEAATIFGPARVEPPADREPATVG